MKTQFRYIVPSVLLLGVVAQMVIAAPPLSFYTPGETTDPTCAPGDTNCDVELSMSDSIYTANGTTGTGRTVGLTDTLNFDSDTFVIDGINDRVGIGTSSPAALLHLYQATGQQQPRVETGDASYATWRSKNTAGDWKAGVKATTGDYAIYDQTIAADRFIIQNTTGNVGIGDTMPENKLSVLGADAEHAMKIISAAGFGVSVDSKTNNPGDAVRMAFQSYRTSDGVADFASIGALEGGLSLSGGGNAITAPHMFVNNSGNVGIGTTNPNSKLHVEDGNLTIRNNATRLLDIDYLGTNPSSSWVYQSFRSQGMEKWWISSNNTDSSLSFQSTSSGFPHVISMHQNGNVGIGRSDPTNILQVGRGSDSMFVDIDGTTSKVLLGHPDLSILAGRGGIAYDRATGDMVLQSTSAGVLQDRIFIEGGVGNVGIGTITPSSKLSVVGLPSSTGIAGTGLAGASAGAVCISTLGDMYIDTDGVCN